MVSRPLNSVWDSQALAALKKNFSLKNQIWCLMVTLLAQHNDSVCLLVVYVYVYFLTFCTLN